MVRGRVEYGRHIVRGKVEYGIHIVRGRVVCRYIVRGRVG